MKVSRFTVNAFGENTYILWQAPGSDAIIVDPGMMKPQEHEAVDAFIDNNKLHVTHVLLTHAHLDHAVAARHEALRYGVKVHASERDEPLAMALPDQALRFGYGGRMEVEPLAIDCYLRQDDTLLLGDEPIKVLETPGHSPGGLSFYAPQSGLVLTGDTIFHGSIGRTDLFGGDFDQLIASIQTQIFTLPPNTLIAPGHDETTTVELEATTNPYVRSSFT